MKKRNYRSVSTKKDRQDVQGPIALSRRDRWIFKAIRACLSPDLLTKRERERLGRESHYVTGHCFVATHAAYQLIGQHRGLAPYWCRAKGGGIHWWLWNPDTREFLDPTSEQAAQPFPYHKGKRCIFYTRRQKRTDELIRRVLVKKKGKDVRL